MLRQSSSARLLAAESPSAPAFPSKLETSRSTPCRRSACAPAKLGRIRNSGGVRRIGAHGSAGGSEILKLTKLAGSHSLRKPQPPGCSDLLRRMIQRSLGTKRGARPVRRTSRRVRSRSHTHTQLARQAGSKSTPQAWIRSNEKRVDDECAVPSMRVDVDQVAMKRAQHLNSNQQHALSVRLCLQGWL